MTFKPVIVVPVYNHGRQMQATADALAAANLPTIIIDDGSAPETAATLAQLAEKYKWLQLIRLPHNQGKGAAVCEGARAAKRLGYTHFLQIDADGQHALGDIPKFLSQAQAKPRAMILGRPIFDDSIPRNRRWGRWLTNVWVWIHTCSLDIRDAMCGFRVYPVEDFLQIINHQRIGQRMDFDIDIVVRLYWLGLQVIHVPTPVIYPKQGLSHFDLWQDNVRITYLHFRLFCGMLTRLPMLLHRKISPTNKPVWFVHRERGTLFWLRFLFWTYRCLGRGLCTFLLFFPVLYFFITDRAACRASRQYLHALQSFQAARGEKPLRPNSWTIFRHIWAFGISTLDKISVWMGDIAPYSVVASIEGDTQRLLNEEKGAILISAHLGNIEIGRSLCEKKRGLVINAIMDNRNAERFNRILEATHQEAMLRVVPIESLGPGTINLLNERLERGEFISVLADRPSADSPGKVTQANFLGQRASFPIGPFWLALFLKRPVYLVFFLRLHGRYHLFCERLCEPSVSNQTRRNEILQGWIEQYAQRLEHYCGLAPLAWFNFFDFWKPSVAIAGEKEAELKWQTS